MLKFFRFIFWNFRKFKLNRFRASSTKNENLICPNEWSIKEKDIFWQSIVGNIKTSASCLKFRKYQKNLERVDFKIDGCVNTLKRSPLRGTFRNLAVDFEIYLKNSNPGNVLISCYYWPNNKKNAEICSTWHDKGRGRHGAGTVSRKIFSPRYSPPNLSHWIPHLANLSPCPSPRSRISQFWVPVSVPVPDFKMSTGHGPRFPGLSRMPTHG